MALSRWARRRKLFYALGVLGFFLLVAAPFVIVGLHEPESCFDDVQNQTETAIDKGGPCTLLDERALQPHAVLWARTFPVRDGFYNAVAYIENPNIGAGVFDTQYQFKIYDERNILIAERFGRVPLLPGKVFPIFESRIDTGNRTPVRAFFTFSNDFVWERMEDPTVGLRVSNQRIQTTTTSPRVDATLHNDDVLAKEDVVIITTLFNSEDNAIASSRTFIERIEGGESLPIAFTWPQPFTDAAVRVDIVPLALPSRSQ